MNGPLHIPTINPSGAAKAYRWLCDWEEDDPPFDCKQIAYDTKLGIGAVSAWLTKAHRDGAIRIVSKASNKRGFKYVVDDLSKLKQRRFNPPGVGGKMGVKHPNVERPAPEVEIRSYPEVFDEFEGDPFIEEADSPRDYSSEVRTMRNGDQMEKLIDTVEQLLFSVNSINEKLDKLIVKPTIDKQQFAIPSPKRVEWITNNRNTLPFANRLYQTYVKYGNLAFSDIEAVKKAMEAEQLPIPTKPKKHKPPQEVLHWIDTHLDTKGFARSLLRQLRQNNGVLSERQINGVRTAIAEETRLQAQVRADIFNYGGGEDYDSETPVWEEEDYDYSRAPFEFDDDSGA